MPTMRRPAAALLVLISLTACTSQAKSDPTSSTTTMAAKPTAPGTDAPASAGRCEDLVGTVWASVEELLGGEAPGGDYTQEHWQVSFDSADKAFWSYTDTGREIDYTCIDGVLATGPEWLDIDPEFVTGSDGDTLLRWSGDLYQPSESPDPSTTSSDGVTVVTDAPDFERFDIVDALESLLRSDGIFEATAVEIGRCCENPVLRVEDITPIDVHDGWQATDDMHSQEYQALYTNLKPGDTLITITRFGTTQLVFDTGGRLLHPVPQAMADALELVMTRERTDNPLEAVRLMWGRYNTPLWYTGPGSLADVYLQGEAGFDNLACSAADLGGDAEDIMERYATAVVPDPVADTRSNLIWAAIACDYETLINLSGADQADDSFWWGANASVYDFQIADRDGALRMLVFALAAFDPAEVASTDGAGAAITYYEWPAAAQLDDIAELDDEQLRLISLMNDMTQQQFIEAWELFGGYGLFRVGIRDDGSWLFALSGD
jgi:hypothetical protein